MLICNVRNKEVMAALNKRYNEKDWYVLRYDANTTEYHNEIVFKNLYEAYEEFKKTEPFYKNEIVELIFSPQNNDLEFGENLIVNQKIFSGKMKVYINPSIPKELLSLNEIKLLFNRYGEFKYGVSENDRRSIISSLNDNYKGLLVNITNKQGVPETDVKYKYLGRI